MKIPISRITGTTLILVCAQAALADSVGYFTDNGTPGDQAAVISASGNTPVEIIDITTFNFSTVKAVFLNEADNGGPSVALGNRLADLNSYVSGGGHLILHDRFVAITEDVPSSHQFLFGHPEIQVERNFSNAADIDLLPAGTVAFPSLTNLSLDNGTSSSHGFAFAATLPSGSVQYLSRGGAPAETVAFQYGYGLGSVYYSTVPLDYYLNHFDGDTDLDANMASMASNAINAALGQPPAIVPEPSAYAAMAGAGLLGFALWRRSRKA